MARVAVVKFPGTNCEEETALALREIAGVEAVIVWHEEFRWRGWDAVVLPGGFSYGDYGRAGLLASWSPAVEELREAVGAGVPVLGICNGFQVLVEAGLLPGGFLVNRGGGFVARWVRLRVHGPRGPWMAGLRDGEVLSMPVANAEGRWSAGGRAGEVLRGRPWLEYLDDPSGSEACVAGLGSSDGMVLGLMPHPERAVWPWQPPPCMEPGGRRFFESIGSALRRGW